MMDSTASPSNLNGKPASVENSANRSRIRIRRLDALNLTCETRSGPLSPWRIDGYFGTVDGLCNGAIELGAERSGIDTLRSTVFRARTGVVRASRDVLSTGKNHDAVDSRAKEAAPTPKTTRSRQARSPVQGGLIRLRRADALSYVLERRAGPGTAWKTVGHFRTLSQACKRAMEDGVNGGSLSELIESVGGARASVLQALHQAAMDGSLSVEAGSKRGGARRGNSHVRAASEVHHDAA